MKKSIISKILVGVLLVGVSSNYAMAADTTVITKATVKLIKNQRLMKQDIATLKRSVRSVKYSSSSSSSRKAKQAEKKAARALKTASSLKRQVSSNKKGMSVLKKKVSKLEKRMSVLEKKYNLLKKSLKSGKGSKTSQTIYVTEKRFAGNDCPSGTCPQKTSKKVDLAIDDFIK